MQLTKVQVRSDDESSARHMYEAKWTGEKHNKENCEKNFVIKQANARLLDITDMFRLPLSSVQLQKSREGSDKPV